VTFDPPVVVGGLGGSGTRVLARLLEEIGFFIGSDLNESLDNLWFTVLFKRPAWYERPSTRQRRAEAAVGPFVGKMTSGRRLTPRELGTVGWAIASVLVRGHDHLGTGRGLRWPARRAASLLAARGHDPAGYAGWGWKEPNSHILIAELAASIPGMRFIHVVRDGDQVAAGRNQTQRMIWSRHLGLAPAADLAADPQAAVRFWALANERTVRLGELLLGERFFVVDVNLLCAEPEAELARLLAFLGLTVEPATWERLVAIPDPAALERSG
jgi:hypothetical protein